VVYIIPKTAVDSAVANGKKIPADSVRVAATGGNILVLGNIELRLPSPIFSSRLRLAAFVDAGGVWQRQSPSASKVVRVTPGVGIRLATPLGPARLDVAYNQYKLQPGPLLQFDSSGALTPVPGESEYVLARNRKYTIHFAVGQPF
jgi:outer membrane protein assembly factor BamA